MAIKSEDWSGAILDYGLPIINAETTAGPIGGMADYTTTYRQLLPTYRLGAGPFVTVYLFADEANGQLVVMLAVGQIASTLTQQQVSAIAPSCLVFMTGTPSGTLQEFFQGGVEVELSVSGELDDCNLIAADPHGRQFVDEYGKVYLRIDATPRAIACDTYCISSVTDQIPDVVTLQFDGEAQEQSADGGWRTTYPVLQPGQQPPATRFGPWFPNGDVNGQPGCENAVPRIGEPIALRRVPGQYKWASDPINVGGCRRNTYLLDISGCTAQLFYASGNVSRDSVSAHAALTWRRIDYRTDIDEFNDDFLGKTIRFSVGEVTFGGDYEPEEEVICTAPSGQVIPGFAFTEGCDGSECPPNEITVTFNVDRVIYKRPGNKTDPGYYQQPFENYQVVTSRPLGHMSKSFAVPLVNASSCTQGVYRGHGSNFSRAVAYYDATFESFDNSLPCEHQQCLPWMFQPDFALPCLCPDNRRFVIRITAQYGGVASPDFENGFFTPWPPTNTNVDILPPQNAAKDLECGCDSRSMVVGFAFTRHYDPPPTSFIRGLLRVAFPNCLTACNGSESDEIDFLLPGTRSTRPGEGIQLSADLPNFYAGYENFNAMEYRATAPPRFNGIIGYEVFLGAGPLSDAYFYHHRIRIKVST